MFQNLPTTRFNTLVIDPPWQQSLTGIYDNRRHSRARRLPYKTLTLDEIQEFPVLDLTNPGSHVYLWTTNKFLKAAFDLFEHWGISFHLCLPLVKKSGIAPCRGYVFAAEYCLLGFAGRPMQPFTAMGKLNWMTTNPKKGTHSAKPDEFYDLIRSMSPGPRLDCFARKAREDFSSWGDEIPNGFQEMSSPHYIRK